MGEEGEEEEEEEGEKKPISVCVLKDSALNVI